MATTTSTLNNSSYFSSQGVYNEQARAQAQAWVQNNPVTVNTTGTTTIQAQAQQYANQVVQNAINSGELTTYDTKTVQAVYQQAYQYALQQLQSQSQSVMQTTQTQSQTQTDASAAEEEEEEEPGFWTKVGNFFKNIFSSDDEEEEEDEKVTATTQTGNNGLGRISQTYTPITTSSTQTGNNGNTTIGTTTGTNTGNGTSPTLTDYKNLEYIMKYYM